MAMMNRKSLDTAFDKVNVTIESQQKQEFRGLLSTVLPMLSQGADVAKEAARVIGGCIQFEMLEDDPEIEAIIDLALNLELPMAHREALYKEVSFEELRQLIGQYLAQGEKP